MKLNSIHNKKSRIFILLGCVIAVWLFGICFPQKQGGMSALKVSANSGNLIKVQAYTVDMQVEKNRKVHVTEYITVEFLQSGLTMFYRSLPTKGCKYENFEASCEGNANFSYEVAYNPDIEGFIDVNCIGGVKRGQVWTYKITYTMLQGVQNERGMTVDLIGFGWSIPLHNVKATMRFPDSLTQEMVSVYAGGYKTSEEYPYTLSDDGKTLTVSAERLDIVYNDTYDERMAKGITVDFTVKEGVFDGYAETRMFTEDIGKLLLGALFCVAVAAVILLTKQKREIIAPIAIKPPEGMSPMLMGKILDGTVDTEDATSMLYYFAHKGYLKIDLTNEDDPELIRLVEELPKDAPEHEKTLFEGLFEEGEHRTKEGGEEYFSVYVSELETKFYDSIQTAKMQLLPPKPMYERKSWILYVIGQCIGGVFAFLASLLMGSKLGGGFLYPFGGIFFLPLAINFVLGIARENYRYKWKAKKRTAIFFVECLISLAFAVVFALFFADHVMTEWEKIVVCIGGLLPALLTGNTLVRTEEYGETLGKILGFKEFIVATEEDKIEYMLQENPELYYEVLPYAQALGVTDEWEKKFAKIAIQPPTWYEGNFTVFDYLIIHRCMQGAMMRSMAEAAKKAQGGGHIGGSGGGGGFGGFGGGGFGGGGGGAR